MAADSDITPNGAVELEAMLKEDFSWHPCQVSLCPSGVGLVVHYENNDLEDILLSEEEALARLRVRSHPLRGDHCTHIEQGEHVLATQKSQTKSPFFDAEVEKALRVRHLKKVHCRCTFMIKWLHQDLKGGTLTVPSSSIMKLAKERVNAHPTISAFLNAVRTSSFSSTSPLSTVVNDMDLDELLEKQIEDISNSVGASKKKTREKLLGLEDHTKELGQSRAVAASNVSESNIQVPPDQNRVRRSTRSRNKLQTQIEVKDPPPHSPSNQEELSENRSPLNPLAARAALASFMSKLPQNLEFSFFHEGGKCFTNSSDFTIHKQVTIESLNVTEDYSSSVMHKFSSKSGAASFVPKPENIVKSLFSTRSASGKPQVLDVSSTVLIKECEKRHNTPEVIDSSSCFTHSTAEKKMSQPKKATRLTHYAVPKVTDIPDDERKTCVEEKKLRFTTSRRFTRSAVNKEEESQTIETTQVVEENMSAKYDESVTSDHNVTAQESYVLKDKKAVATASPINVEIDSLLPAERNHVKTVRRIEKNDIERKTRVAEIKNICNTRRLTRSAVHKETENTTMETIRGLEAKEFPENGISNSSGENVSTLDINMLETFGLHPTEERNKKRMMSGGVKTTQETEGNVASDGGSSQGLKRKSISSKKHEVRFSTRLRFLPRTRSQKKA